VREWDDLRVKIRDISEGYLSGIGIAQFVPVPLQDTASYLLNLIFFKAEALSVSYLFKYQLRKPKDFHLSGKCRHHLGTFQAGIGGHLPTENYCYSWPKNGVESKYLLEYRSPMYI